MQVIELLADIELSLCPLTMMAKGMNLMDSSRCPECRRGWIVRVRRRGFVDWLRSFLGMLPFWCEACDAKFYRRPKRYAQIEQRLD